MDPVQAHAACPYPAPEPPRGVAVFMVPEHECPYLPGRRCRTRAVLAERMGGKVYQEFMDAAFRRSGRAIYQPACRGCRRCLSLRVPVGEFRPSKSQRRCWRRNADLWVELGRPEPTGEKFELYRRYVTQRHDAPAGMEDWEGFVSFLYDSPVETIECCYRDRGRRLLAVGLCDLCPRSLSSVYCYFEPQEARRGLGTFSALYEIEMARRRGLTWYYMGYWVEGCRSMRYKAEFRPNEVLWPEGRWGGAGPQRQSMVGDR